MIDVLSRRRQNNPLLTGDAGICKTAVVEGLVLAIAQRSVPPALADTCLMLLDVGAVLVGASVKGKFEARLKSVLDAAAKSPQSIMFFVDEIHTLIGAGGQAGTGDAANLLKPALARGTMRLIGAMTWSEYKRHIEKDPALTRRFQTLQVSEPDEATAIGMVRGLAETFASHHGVIVLDEAIRAAVSLSHRYIPARQLPDKAISLLDTAYARVALSQHAEPPDLQDVRQRMQMAQTELRVLEAEAHRRPHADRTADAVRAQIHELTRLRADALARRLTGSDGRAGSVAEVSDYLLLQALNRYEPLLQHLRRVSATSPADLYALLVSMAGELSTYVRPATRRPLDSHPPYQHIHPHLCLKPVVDDTHWLLNAVLIRSAQSIPFEEARYGMRNTVVSSAELLSFTSMVLAVSAAMPPDALVAEFTAQAKMGPSERLSDLVRAHLPGIALQAMPVPPRQIPFNSGYVYFELSRSGPLWERVAEHGGIALHVTGDFPQLKLELWGIRA